MGPEAVKGGAPQWGETCSKLQRLSRLLEMGLTTPEVASISRTRCASGCWRSLIEPRHWTAGSVWNRRPHPPDHFCHEITISLTAARDLVIAVITANGNPSSFHADQRLKGYG